MAEEEKVTHILKGIADMFTLLVFKNSLKVPDIIAQCCHLKKPKAVTLPTTFLAFLTWLQTSTCKDLHLPPMPAVSDSIVHIVWREIEAASPVPPQVHAPDDSHTTLSLIQTAQQQQLAIIVLP